MKGGPALVLSAYVVVSVATCFYYSSITPSPDQSLYDYIAWQGTRGVQWYVGSFDVTWPGNLLFHDLGIRIFGVHKWTARMFDFLLLQPALLGIFVFLKSAGLRYGAWASLILYPIVYVTSGSWMAGHRDIVAMHFMICAAAIVSTSRNRQLGFFLAGLLVGYAVLLRPTYLAFAPVLLIAIPYKSIRVAMPPTLSLGIGVLFFPLAFVVAGLATHTLSAWFEAGVGFVLNVYQEPASRMRLAGRFVENVKEQFLWLVAIAAAASCFWWRAKVHGAMLLGMVFTVLTSFVVQNKGFAYHLGGLIPVLAIIALGGANLAIGATRISSWLPPQMIGAALMVIFSFGVERRIQNAASILVHEEESDQTVREQKVQEILSVIAKESTIESRFFQWGWNYDVAFRSQRLSASRFIDTPLFSMITPSSPANYVAWIEAFSRDLDEAKPEFVLVDLSTLPSSAMPAGGSNSALSVLATHLDRDYTFRLSFPDTILYKRRRDCRLKAPRV